MKKQLQSGEKLFIVTSVVESEKLIGTYPGAPVGAKDADLIRNAVQTLHPHLVTLEAAKEGNAISLSADPRLLWEFETREVKLIDGKLTIDEMTGGTFTITNGGVFGSMLSTPIINPPQSAILGMHNIVDRPVAVNGQVVIRPVMFLALSYDHRIIDGKESVSFLMAIKQMVEDPTKMVFGGKEPGEVLLGL